MNRWILLSLRLLSCGLIFCLLTVIGAGSLKACATAPAAHDCCKKAHQEKNCPESPASPPSMCQLDLTEVKVGIPEHRAAMESISLMPAVEDRQSPIVVTEYPPPPLDPLLETRPLRLYNCVFRI
jgi:hypothetical protein